MEDSDGNSVPGDWESPTNTGIDYAALRALERRGRVDRVDDGSVEEPPVDKQKRTTAGRSGLLLY